MQIRRSSPLGVLVVTVGSSCVFDASPDAFVADSELGSGPSSEGGGDTNGATVDGTETMGETQTQGPTSDGIPADGLRIVTFSASPNPLPAGATTILAWSSEDAEACAIAPDLGSVELEGSASVTIAVDTTYALTCTRGAESVEASVDVVVDDSATGVPGVHSFAANVSEIAPGSETTLTWTLSGVAACELDHGFGTVSAAPGSYQQVIRPMRTALYRLECRTDTWQVFTAETLVEVIGEPRRLFGIGVGAHRVITAFDYTKERPSNPDPDFVLVDDVAEGPTGDNEFSLRGVAAIRLPEGASALLAVGGGTAEPDDPLGHDFQGMRWYLSTPPGEPWSARGYEPGGWASSAVQTSDRTIVVAGSLGAVWTSSDGSTWIERETPVYAHFRALIYAAGRLIAAGNNATLATSRDGIDWIDHTAEVTSLDPALATARLSRIAYGQGVTIIVSETRDPALTASVIRVTPTSDGQAVDIEQIALPAIDDVIDIPQEAVWGNGTFIVQSNRNQFVSPDGITWAYHQSNVAVQGIAYYGDGAFAGHQGGTYLVSAPAADGGYDWTPVGSSTFVSSASTNRWLAFDGGL